MKSRDIALAASFAALYFILSRIPGIPAIGIPQVKIQLEAAFASVFGLILGPVVGALAAFTGTLIAFFYTGANPFGLPFILCPASNALTVGLMFKNKFKIAFAILAAIIIGFWLTPPVQPITDYWYIGVAATFDKIIALLLIIPLARAYSKGIFKIEGSGNVNSKKLFIYLFIASFIGNQTDSALGTTLFAIPQVYNGIYGLSLKTTRSLFLVSPLAYPAIRLIQAFIATLVGLPLFKAFKSRGWIIQ